MEKKIYVSKYNKSLSSYNRLKLLIGMLEVRVFEEKSIQSYQESKIGGFCHTYIGQEAVTAGVLSTLNTEDHVITGYRDHAHALFLNTNPSFLMSELYGKYTGCSNGKGGSMHFFNSKKRFWGGHGIVAAQAPLGTGLAFSLKYSSTPFNTKGVCVCFLGEGAVNQGVFYESLNLSVLWKLPVMYIIENNKYSMGTEQKNSFAGVNIAKKFKEFKVSWGKVKRGYCIYSIRTFMHGLLKKMRFHNTPGVLEINTYRYKGHSMSDPDKTYRSKKEVVDYKHKYDPIKSFEHTLIGEGVLQPKQVSSLLALVTKRVKSCVNLSNGFPYPKIRSVFNHIYWDVDHLYFKKSKGVIFF